MDISGTAKKVQRATKVAEESYKKMQTMMEKMQEMREQIRQLQSDMETTSEQVDDMEREMTEQRALVEAIAREQGIDVDSVLADLPDNSADSAETLAQKATSKPSASENQ